MKEKDIWIKCTNSPIWVRDGIGDAKRQAGLPYQDPKKFNEWIERTIGMPEDTEIALIGLTLDCCILCAAQEFNFRGYKVNIVREAVDVYSGEQDEKVALFKTPVGNWAGAMGWEEVQQRLNA